MGSTRICKAGAYQDLEDEEIRPRDFGLRHAEVEELQGGDAKQNAEILEAILSGREAGPKRDMVLLNAGAALACCGLADTLNAGLDLAREAIDGGGALDRLRRLQKVCATFEG
jgi:anthranilate phosphoribosyltransferase